MLEREIAMSAHGAGESGDGQSVGTPVKGAPCSALGVTVALGSGTDVCPLCGIHRENAGFLKETCGSHYREPGCFIVDDTEEQAST